MCTWNPCDGVERVNACLLYSRVAGIGSWRADRSPLPPGFRFVVADQTCVTGGRFAQRGVPSRATFRGISRAARSFSTREKEGKERRKALPYWFVRRPLRDAGAFRRSTPGFRPTRICGVFLTIRAALFVEGERRGAPPARAGQTGKGQRLPPSAKLLAGGLIAAGRSPGSPGVTGCEPGQQAPHPPPLHERLEKRPSGRGER